MNIVISGSRSFDDYKYFHSVMKEYLTNRNKEDIVIVAGAARGADTMAKNYASKYGYEFYEIPADWNLKGKAAGIIRNVQMAEIADEIIAFWDGRSKGTAHMIGEALKRKIKLKVFDI